MRNFQRRIQKDAQAANSENPKRPQQNTQLKTEKYTTPKLAVTRIGALQN
jgi:hypothetical protein